MKMQITKKYNKYLIKETVLLLAATFGEGTKAPLS